MSTRQRVRKKLPPGVIRTAPISVQLPDMFDPFTGRAIPEALIPDIAADNDGRMFPSGTPNKPLMEPGAAPRSIIPPPFHNTTTGRRRWRPIDLTPFDQLRALSRFDLVRAVIRDVKGQILGMDLEVTAKKEFEGDTDIDGELTAGRAFLQIPDPVAGLDLKAWIGKVIEEVVVTDALSLYPQFTESGDPLGLAQIDGTTIKPLVDNLGRPPTPPNAAFVQFVHGMPETEFTFPVGDVSPEELWYMPYERQPDTPYGFPPLEQVMLTVNLALRHQLHDLAYFTSGNLPDSLYTVPESWSEERIGEMQTWWNDILEGRSDVRSGGLRFVPKGDYIATKTREFKYEFVEYLGRVISWVFGVSPLPIMRISNRAQAETMEQSVAESGIRPLVDFVVRVMNRYLKRVLHLDRVEVRVSEDETEDATVVYQRQAAFVGAGILSRDEVRQKNGEDAIGMDEPTIDTAAGPIFISDLLKSREESEKQDAARINPSLIQRAFLEVPVMTRDELRGSIGLPPVGGDEGGEFITIQQIGATTPTKPGDNPFTPTPDDSITPEPDDADADGVLALLHKRATDRVGAIAVELSKWKRFASRRMAKGRQPRTFKSTIIPALLRRAALDCIVRADLASWPTIAKAEGTLSPEAATLESKIEQAVRAWLASQLPEVVATATSILDDNIEKVDATDFGSQFEFTGTDDLFSTLESILSQTYGVGAGDAELLAVGVAETGIAPETAVAYAQERAAELVGKKWVGGKLVTNPNPQFAITESLRADVSSLVNRAVADGESTEWLSSQLQESFGPWRSETIARTETGFAYNAGAGEVYESSDVDFVEVLDGVGCLPKGHNNSAPLPTGAVGTIESGSQADGQVWTIAQMQANPLGHPNCVRGFVPYAAGE